MSPAAAADDFMVVLVKYVKKSPARFAESRFYNGNQK